MATDIAPSHFAGLLLPEPLSYWSAQHTAGQASPIPDRPSPAADSSGRYPRLQLTASGTMTAGTSLTVTCRQGGQIGDAGFKWKRSTDTLWRYWLPPVGLFGWYPVAWTTGASTTYGQPHAVALPNGDELVVYERTVGTTRSVRSKKWSASSDAYGSSVELETGLDLTEPNAPTAVVLPDGRILCLFVRSDATLDQAQVAAYVTRDSGTTWDPHSEDTLRDGPIAIDTGGTYYAINRLRAVHINNTILLVVDLTSNGGTRQLWHYASADDGATFELITTYSGRGPCDLKVAGGRAWMAYRSASNAGFIVSVANAFQPFPLDETVGGTADITSDIALVTMSDRYLWLLAKDNDGAQEPGVAAQYDTLTGALSQTITSDIASWYNDGQGTAVGGPVNFCATSYRGQARVYAHFTSSGGTYDSQIGRLDVGGYSTITWPKTRKAKLFTTFATPLNHWTPIDLPSAVGWTFNGAGTTSITTNPGSVTLTTAAASAYYSKNVTAVPTSDHEIWVMARVFLDAGGDITADDCSIIVRLATTGEGYTAALRLSDTQIRAYDVIGTASRGTASALTTANGVDVLLCVGAGVVSAWYRAIGADAEMGWTNIVSAGTLTDDAAAAGTQSYIQFGNIASATTTSRWRVVQHVQGTVLGEASLAGGFDGDVDGWPAPFTGAPQYVAEGVSIRGVGGPAALGDSWTIAQTARYPVAAILGRNGDSVGPAPSPSAAWRSTTVSGTIRLALQWPRSADTALPRGLYGLRLSRMNTGNVTVKPYTGGTVGASVGTLSNTGTALPYRLDGHRLIPNPAGSFTTKPRFDWGRLAGGYVVLPAGVGSVVRPILRNGSGRWSADGVGPIADIELDPTSLTGAEDATGTMVVRYPDAVLVLALAGTTRWQGLILEWSSPATYEGYVSIGALDFGPIIPLGHGTDWGDEYATTNPLRTSELARGVLLPSDRYRKAGRRVALALGPAMGLSSLRASTPVTYMKPSATGGVPPMAEPGDHFDAMAGLMLEGRSRWPVVWLPAIARADMDAVSYVGDRAGVRGYLTSEEWAQSTRAGAPDWSAFAYEGQDMVITEIL